MLCMDMCSNWIAECRSRTSTCGSRSRSRSCSSRWSSSAKRRSEWTSSCCSCEPRRRCSSATPTSRTWGTPCALPSSFCSFRVTHSRTYECECDCLCSNSSRLEGRGDSTPADGGVGGARRQRADAAAAARRVGREQRAQQAAQSAGQCACYSAVLYEYLHALQCACRCRRAAINCVPHRLLRADWGPPGGRRGAREAHQGTGSTARARAFTFLSVSKHNSYVLCSYVVLSS